MKKRIYTIKEICEFIFCLEEKYGLLDFKIRGVNIWQCSRMKLYYMLSIQSGALQEPHSHTDRIGVFRKLYLSLKTIFRHNYFTLPRSDALVYSHPRVTFVDDEYIDIYTKFFIDEQLENGERITEIESSKHGYNSKKEHKFSHRNDWINLSSRLCSKMITVSLSDHEEAKISLMEKEIFSFFGCEIDLNSFFTTCVEDFIATEAIYKMAFKKTKAKTIYIVVSYFNAPVISAAKACGMQVIELQHGTFSQYHLGYSFPNRKKPLDYFPDKLYVWNEYWKGLISMPISESNVIVDKFRFLENEKSRYSHLIRNDNQVVVLSQGAIGEEIAGYFLNHIHLFGDYDIFYKLHPGEFDSYKSYPSLKRLSERRNLKIIKDEIPLYELFATSKWQVGVFSTALYEGAEFGCETILLNINGIEYMDRFIELNDRVKVV